MLAGGSRADQGPGPESGYWSKAVGPGASSSNLSHGAASWNAAPSPKTLSLLAYGVAMSPGMCETTYFDWGLSPITHHDARAVRTCRNSASSSRAWNDSTSTIDGVQKLGVCYALKDTLSSGSGGGCSEYPNRTASIVSIPPAFNSTVNCSVSWYIVPAVGSAAFYGGGSPTKSSCP